MIQIATDLRAALLPIRQQGRRHSCLAFASTAAHEHGVASTEYLCVEYLYYHSVKRMPGQNAVRGTSMAAAAEALANEGQPVEAAWPYNAVDTNPWTPPIFTGPVLKANLSVGSMNFSGIVAALDAGKPVVLGLIVTDAFYRPDTKGHVSYLAHDPDRSGHAVLAVGHIASPQKDAALLVRNSWGSGWGVGGYGWLPQAYVERQLRETALLT